MATTTEVNPLKVLSSIAYQHDVDILSPEFAKIMDEMDPLRHFRERFTYPKNGTLPNTDKKLVDPNEECVYLCGNSLGLKPRTADTYVQQQLDKWAETGVETHFLEPLPASRCDQYGKEEMGRLVGAKPSSVTLMNGLTVNLHLLLMSFYQPTNARYKILLEGHAFPSDRYAMRSQAKLRGFDPDDAVIEVYPRPNEHTIRTEDILKLLEQEGEKIAVVCMSGVQYYTGQKFDMGLITKAAHDKGCFVGWDLAHAVGNVEIRLDDWDVDFACWCTYKYMNSGPGCLGGAYVNSKHNKRNTDHLHGWWSNKETTRFEMRDECDVADGVDSFRLCNPPPILVALAKASLEIFEEAKMENLLKKQFLLTGYLEHLVKTHFSSGQLDAPTATIITPEDTTQRGCQLSFTFSFPLKQIHKEIQKRGVVCDVRLPNAMRITPVPLYNSFRDVYNFIKILQEVFALCKTEGA
ncbi:LOW QUALITY PROTEIN: kynureninase-like [Macrobrachium rosenbergii]|uniref:LOW QUALITY PROTEIN: kynureninase-like n=1 Tax=Macrobrachium rosenbergii TaxID=79674 RepID=UPI0034D76C31